MVGNQERYIIPDQVEAAVVTNLNVAVAPDISSLGATAVLVIPVAVPELGVAGVTKLTLPVLPRLELPVIHDLHMDTVTDCTMKIPGCKRILIGMSKPEPMANRSDMKVTEAVIGVIPISYGEIANVRPKMDLVYDIYR